MIVLSAFCLHHSWNYPEVHHICDVGVVISLFETAECAFDLYVGTVYGVFRGLDGPRRGTQVAGGTNGRKCTEGLYLLFVAKGELIEDFLYFSNCAIDIVVMLRSPVAVASVLDPFLILF